MKVFYVIALVIICSQVNAVNFTVNTTNDTGIGSLRQAIIDANNAVGQDSIDFTLPGAGPHIIQPLTNLPTITDALLIDGYTQNGSSANTQLLGTDANLQVILDGSINTSLPTVGLTVQTNGSSIAGLSIVGFPTIGVLLSSGATLVSGNFIGVLPDGVTTQFNGIGIHIESNLSQFNLIGGSVVANKNLISGNIFDAILVESHSNRIMGNIIGVDRTGSIALSQNTNTAGVRIINADNNIVGGTLPAERNLISANGSGGIFIDGTFSANNTQVINNIIGLDADAIQAIGNGMSPGITMSDATDSILRDNIVSGNATGISLTNLSRDNTFENNLIGGTATTGNFIAGMFIQNGAGPNNIGNPNNQIGNIISFNGNGVIVERTDTQENRIMFNRIFSNSGLGVDLTDGSFGVNPNDVGDIDFGGNNFLNFPDITSSQIVTGMLQISGSYSGLSNENFTFEVFANQQCNLSGNGEGEIIIGYITGTTDASGVLTFNQNFTIPPAGFNFITMLATDSNNNTSEFSQCFETMGSIASFTVNVATSGLEIGNIVELQNNLTDNLVVNNNGTSQFSTAIIDGGNYSVTILNQPITPIQNCTVINANGIINGADVTVNVNCITGSVSPIPQVIPATSVLTLILLVLMIFTYTGNIYYRRSGAM